VLTKCFGGYLEERRAKILASLSLQTISKGELAFDDAQCLVIWKVLTIQTLCAMQTKPFYIIALLFTTAIFGCQTSNPYVKSRLETTKSFLNYVKANDTTQAYNSMYHPKGSKYLNDKGGIYFKIMSGHELIDEYGLSPQNMWIIKFDARDNYERLTVEVPLFKTTENDADLKNAYILITFPPPEISDRILKFEVVSDRTRNMILEPLKDPSNQ
jgi:hypothetical protein